MPKRFATLSPDGLRVMQISLCEDYESAVAFHGEGRVVEETEATGEARAGYHWDGLVFTPGDINELISLYAPKEIVEE